MLERDQTLDALKAELKKWDDAYIAARNNGKHLRQEIANARSNEVAVVARLLGFSPAELFGSPYIPGSEADKAWKEEQLEREKE